MKTYLPKADGADRKWTIVDAEGQVLGRLASQVATRLRGKHRPDFTPHLDTGDFVVVVNAAKIRVTGAKMDNKMYYRYSGYPGGLKETNLRVMLEKKPEEVIFHAVKGMLPKNRLGRKMLKKLRVYGGAEHPHAAQQPEQLEL
jgi:large subunit ribosomal protein L13